MKIKFLACHVQYVSKYMYVCPGLPGKYGTGFFNENDLTF